MSMRLPVAIIATAALSSASTAVTVLVTQPQPVDAAAGDARIVRELRTISARIGNNGYDNRSLRGALHAICANGREFASTCP